MYRLRSSNKDDASTTLLAFGSVFLLLHLFSLSCLRLRIALDSVGLTLAGDGAWSARFWQRTAPRTYPVAWCASVRVVGDSLSVTFMEKLAPAPKSSEQQIRTVSAWGDECQANLVRLRAGVIGAGSVGGMIAEALARTGFEDVTLIDFDVIKKQRTLYEPASWSDRICLAEESERN